jgi:hypothetical protein
MPNSRCTRAAVLQGAQSAPSTAAAGSARNQRSHMCLCATGVAQLFSSLVEPACLSQALQIAHKQHDDATMPATALLTRTHHHPNAPTAVSWYHTIADPIGAVLLEHKHCWSQHSIDTAKTYDHNARTKQREKSTHCGALKWRKHEPLVTLNTQCWRRMSACTQMKVTLSLHETCLLHQHVSPLSSTNSLNT